MTPERRAVTNDLIRSLREPLRAALNEDGDLDPTPLSEGGLADGTTVLLLRDARRRPRAVVLCSSPAAPSMVHRAMVRARLAKDALGESLGLPILDPLTEGTVDGRTFSVLPYCRPFSTFRPVWWMQRARLRPVLLDWLFRATERTARDVETDAIESTFGEPLRRLESLPQASGRVRSAAGVALEDLRSGAWRPRIVLMHGDLWTGNVLVRPSTAGSPERWGERLVVIDWAGSEVSGHGMYDLVRLAQSLALSPRALRDEVLRHCRPLGCGAPHALHHLLAALGHVLTHLEFFPVDRFARMVVSCVTTLESSCGRP
jgi:hypothetical protein